MLLGVKSVHYQRAWFPWQELWLLSLSGCSSRWASHTKRWDHWVLWASFQSGYSVPYILLWSAWYRSRKFSWDSSLEAQCYPGGCRSRTVYKIWMRPFHCSLPRPPGLFTLMFFTRLRYVSIISGVLRRRAKDCKILGQRGRQEDWCKIIGCDAW